MTSRSAGSQAGEAEKRQAELSCLGHGGRGGSLCRCLSQSLCNVVLLSTPPLIQTAGRCDDDPSLQEECRELSVPAILNRTPCSASYQLPDRVARHLSHPAQIVAHCGELQSHHDQVCLIEKHRAVFHWSAMTLRMPFSAPSENKCNAKQRWISPYRMER